MMPTYVQLEVLSCEYRLCHISILSSDAYDVVGEVVTWLPEAADGPSTCQHQTSDRQESASNRQPSMLKRCWKRRGMASANPKD